MFLKILSLFILFCSADITGSAKEPGDIAEDFTVNSSDGITYNLKDAVANSANGVVLIFWSTTCPWVQPYNDRINNYVKDLNDKGFIVWGINSNKTESPEEVANHAKENQYIFPMLKDLNNKIADLYEATRTPEAFLIGKDMIIKYHGRISDNRKKSEETVVDLLNAAGEIAEGREVSVKKTKQFGCTIKRVGDDN